MGNFISDLKNIKNLFTDPKNNWRQIILVCIPIIFLLFSTNTLIGILIGSCLGIGIINLFFYLNCNKLTDSEKNSYKINLNESFKQSAIICIPLFIYMFCKIIINMLANPFIIMIYKLCSIGVGLVLSTLFTRIYNETNYCEKK
jgi:hypothetical protein